MPGLRLSKQHGVNPSVQKCFWCGKDIGVVMFGVLPGDKEAPRECVLDYEPCAECVEQMKQGATLIEATHSERDGATPTGRWMVLKQEAFDRLFPAHAGKIKAYVEPDFYAQLSAEYQPPNETNKRKEDAQQTRE